MFVFVNKTVDTHFELVADPLKDREALSSALLRHHHNAHPVFGRAGANFFGCQIINQRPSSLKTGPDGELGAFARSQGLGQLEQVVPHCELLLLLLLPFRLPIFGRFFHPIVNLECFGQMD